MKRIIATVLLLIVATAKLGAIATPTAISTATLAGNTLTVNSTAHGLAVNQGFCINGSSIAADNVCAVVATVPNANSFTFTLVGVAACAASCGTVQPARQIVVLDTPGASQAEVTVNYILWLTTQQGVAVSSTSQVVGATTAELAAIGAGRFKEVARPSKTFPSGTTLAQIKTILQADYVAQQAALAANVQPGQFFGNYFDGVSWLN